ncbi:MAG: hypothetical protein CL528_00490 [Aequorivita sp.]|jgi:hypothetical protein|nr:hypothetical protein [Aequorivita sp.]MBP40228.1 hypothetical protein [Aequorivita sp.]|tara:strand:+ start:1242 stop:1523 length:282 start_codon:yes stop_codon:yes gene_type:complete
MQTVADFYTKRNAELLRQWLKLTRGGMNIREAAKTVAENNEGITEGLINGIVYNKKYPYAAEAWAIIHKEEEAAEKLKKEKPGTATTPVVAKA